MGIIVNCIVRRLETSNSIFSLILRHQTIPTREFLFMSIAYEAGAEVLQIIFTIGGGHQQSCVLNRTCALKSGSIFQFGRGLNKKGSMTLGDG